MKRTSMFTSSSILPEVLKIFHFIPNSAQFRFERHGIGAGHSVETKTTTIANHFHRRAIGCIRTFVQSNSLSGCVHTRGVGPVDGSNRGPNSSEYFLRNTHQWQSISSGYLCRFGSAIVARDCASTRVQTTYPTWDHRCRRCPCRSIRAT